MAGGTDPRYVVPGEAIGTGVRDDSVQRPLPGVPMMLVAPDGTAVIAKGDADGNLVSQTGSHWRAAINTTVSANTITITVPAVVGQSVVLDTLLALGDNIFCLIDVSDEVPTTVMRFNVGAQNRYFTGGDLASTLIGDDMVITMKNVTATGLMGASGRYV